VAVWTGRPGRVRPVSGLSRRATTAQRRGEIAVLRLNGTTPRQILAMMRRESAVISAAALTMGLLLSAIPLALLGVGFQPVGYSA